MYRTAMIVAFTATVGWCAMVELSACPFCTASLPTLDERFRGADVVIVARRVAERVPSQPVETAAGATSSEASALYWRDPEFEVVEVLKGKGHVSPGARVRAFSLVMPSQRNDVRWVLFGRQGREIAWTETIDFTDRSLSYLKTMITLSPRSVEQLRYVKDYLEDADRLLAGDAYEVFARADYATIQALAPELNAEQLTNWIDNPTIAGKHKRLYLTLLSTCGNADHARQLEAKILAATQEDRLWLDALVSAYLALRGEDGLALIDEQFLRNPAGNYRMAHSVALALRFHLNSINVIPRDRLLASYRLGLSYEELVPLIIPDLARLEDWSAIDQAVELFRLSDNSQWVRVPVMRYLKACPLPEARERLAELTELDPESAKRAELLAKAGTQTAATTKYANGTAAADPRGNSGPGGSVDYDIAPTTASRSLATAATWQTARGAIIGIGLVLVIAVVIRLRTGRQASERTT